MRLLAATAVLSLLLATPAVRGQVDSDPLAEVPETVYGQPPLRTPGTGYNDGALNLAIYGLYRTDYVFRGLELFDDTVGGEDDVNLGFEGDRVLDLGRLPDPFVRIITNTAEGDSVSEFQIIRPTVGLTFANDLFDLVVGHQSYTYPDRDELDTAEVIALLAIHGAWLAGGEGAFLGPYLFVAHDYDAFDGTYFEAGVRRDFRVGESSLRLGYEAHVAYVESLPELFGGDGRGFQHYELGLRAGYDLNQLLNISRRFGRWSLEGEIHYTDGLADDLVAETQIWGGGGIGFRY